MTKNNCWKINKIKEFFKKLGRLLWFDFGDIFNDMGIRLGPFDPLQLIFQIMNSLMQKGLISYDDARQILKASMPPDSEMSESEKEKILDDLIKKVEPPR